MLGAVIGLTLVVNILIATSVGGMVHHHLKRVGEDLAAASVSLSSTITEIAVFLVLSLATIFIPVLV